MQVQTRHSARALTATLVAAVALAALLLPAQASARTVCAMENGARYCAADSTDFPNTTGWYGYIGQGNACGPTPIHGWHTGAGVCGGPDSFYNEQVWRSTTNGWAASTLPIGTAAYVAPYAKDWRWVYTQKSGWVAISASRLVLKWRA